MAQAAGARPQRSEPRLEIVIAIALGLAAIVTAASVYLNEQQEHKATLDFHQATHRLIDSMTAGTGTPAGSPSTRAIIAFPCDSPAVR